MAATSPPPWLQRLTPRLFYGWWVAVGCSLLSLVIVGTGFYGMVILLDALVTDRGWSRASVSAATSAYWVITGLVGLAIGRGVDRVGARRFLAAGALLMAVALAVIGRLTAPWQILPAYALLATGFALAGAVPTSALITRWFTRRRSLAMTVSHTGVSLGGILLTPLLTGWIRANGLTVALDRLALMLLLVALPLVAAVLRSGPERFGLHPDGDDPDAPALAGPSDATPDRTWDRGQVLRTRTFQTLATAYGVMLTCQVATSMHLLSFLRERLDAETAALGVSALALGSFLGRLMVGPLADRVPKRHLAAALFAFQAAMVAILAGSTERIPLLAASLGVGLTVGNIFMLQSLLVAELFGRLSFATAMGMQQVVSQVASGCGPLLLGLLVAVHGGYPTALLWLAGGAAVAAVLITRVKPPEPVAG